MLPAMAQENRRQISLRASVWLKATRLKEALAATSGRRVTITDTVDRALDCLADAHSRGAWLSPEEAAPLLEERLRKEVVSVLAQFIARAMPDRNLAGVTFKPAAHRGGGGTLYVHLDNNTVPMLMGAAEAVRSTSRV